MKDLGPLRKVDPAVVDDDRFWSEVRRRHPDVDLVLLPPDDADAAAVLAPLPPTLVRTVAAAAVDAWRTLAPLLVERREPDPPAVRWVSADGGHALLVTKAVRGLGEDGGVDLLGDVAEVLGRRGWRLAPSRRTGHPLLRATDGQVDLEAEAGPGATVLRLATRVLPTEASDRDAVLDEVLARLAEGTPSWP